MGSIHKKADAVAFHLEGQNHEIFLTQAFSWIYPLWGSDFEAKRTSTFVFRIRKVIKLFMIPRCKLQRGFKIPSVAYSGDLNPRCSL